MLQPLQSLLADLRTTFPDVRLMQLHAPEHDGLLQTLKHRRKDGRRTREQLRRLSRGGLLIVDGVEQLRWFDQARLIRSAKRNQQCLLCTAHGCVRGLALLHRTTVDRRIVTAMTRELIADAPAES